MRFALNQTNEASHPVLLGGDESRLPTDGGYRAPRFTTANAE